MLAVPVATAAAVVAGCGQGFDRDHAIDTFVEANPEATPEQAACVVDELIERYGLDDLDNELRADTPDAGFEEEQFRQMFLCGVEGDIRRQLTDQLIANGIGEDDAPCVADALVDGITDDDVDVLLSGQITDEFNDKFHDALEECDAL
ncbi:MAG: hypothetical protein ACFCVK_15630 [Acidimicrobiales bacterium]